MAHRNTSLSRRQVLRATAGTAGIAALGTWSGLWTRRASAGVTGGKHVVIVNLFGGNDGLGTIIPALSGPYGAYASRRPTIAIDPTTDYSFPNATDYPNGDPRAGKDVNDFMLGTDYVAHPAMNRIAGLYQSGDMAVVNLMGYPNENLSHFTSEDIWSRGVRGSFAPGTRPSGWIVRMIDRISGDARGAISIGVGQRRDFLGGTTDPLSMSRPGNFSFDRVGSTSNHAFKLETIREVLAANSMSGAGALARDAMDQAHELVDEISAAASVPTPQDANYSGDTPSRYLEDIARLIQAGSPTCLYYTGFGGFDTHGEQGSAGVNDRHGRLLRRLDDAVGVFSDDMKAMGRWNDTVIVVISEFGRRNFENGSNGTDHGHGNPVMVFGGDVNGGVYGPDVTAALINDERWMPFMGADFRDVYREILTDHLGVGAGDLAQIFPEAQDNTQSFGLVS